jgi:hypothetical protein
VTTLQVLLQLHGQMKGLPHHDTKHGTVEMVESSDEDGSSLSFNSGGAMTSSRSPPSSWQPPLGLAMISLECPPPRVSLVVDRLFLGGSEGLDDVSGEWRLAPAIRLHILNTEERGTRTATKVGWAGPNGPTGLGLFWAGSGPFFSPLLILTFCTWHPSFVSF